jgi:hypothetical protein
MKNRDAEVVSKYCSGSEVYLTFVLHASTLDTGMEVYTAVRYGIDNLFVLT